MNNIYVYYGRDDGRPIRHYNHNHDKLGRFASSPGGGLRKNRTAARLAKATTKAERQAAKNPTSHMTIEEIQADNKRQKAIRQYKNNHRDTSLDEKRIIVNETSNVVNRLKNSNREAMRQEQRNAPRMDLSHMTDQQLRDRINRENLERQYNQMFNTSSPEVSKGRQRVDRVLDVGGDLLMATGSALSIALAIKALRG